jgi:ABC-2 type transport system permease protein
MLSESVPAVQALGQAIFLPMIMVGGVGFPLRTLPVWAQHVAAFLPGRYAVEALQSCAVETSQRQGLHGAGFQLLALTIIGISGCFAGAKLFRWDAGQKLAPSARAWIVPALASWAVVGILAEASGKAVVYRPPNPQVVTATPTTPASRPTTSIASTEPIPATMPIGTTTAPAIAPAPWQAVTPAQIKAITYDDLEPDSGAVTPVLDSLDGLDEDAKKRIEAFTEKLNDWQPGMDPDLPQKLRNFLSVAAVADLLQDEQEAAFPYVIFDKLKFDVPATDLSKALTYIILKPDEGRVLTSAMDLGINGEADEARVRERVTAYAKKLLYRVLAKGAP